MDTPKIGLPEEDQKLVDPNKKEKTFDEIEYRNRLFLSREKPDYKSLAIGIHNNVFYLGTKILDGDKEVDAIITSDKKMYVGKEIKDSFKLNFKYKFIRGVLNHSVSNEIFNRWLYDECLEEEHYSLEKIYEELLKINVTYVYHPDERVHKYIALDIIKTYFLPIWESIGRTLFKAERGSGKTRQAQIYSLLSFNAVSSPDISGASFFRVVESTNATIVIDDFDAIDEEKKWTIMQHIRTGYKKGGKTIRSEGKNHIPTSFNNFSHVIINNISGLDEVTENRCIVILMLKTEDNKLSALKLKFNDLSWQILRDRLSICALSNWEKVERTYTNLEIIEFINRDLERSEAILVLAKCISEELYNEMLGFFKEKFTEEQIVDLHDNWEFLIYKYLYENVHEDKHIRYEEICEAVCPSLFDVNDKDYKKLYKRFNYFLRKVFKDHILFKKRLINGKTEVFIKRKDLEKMIRLKNYKKHLEISTISPISTNPINSTISPISTENVVDIVENVEKVDIN